MNKSQLRWTAIEEASIPEHPTREQLDLWRHSKTGVSTFLQSFLI